MFATVDDIIKLWRPLEQEEIERAEALIEVVSDMLKEEARAVGKNLDKMSDESVSYSNVLKSVVVDVVARTLMTSTKQEPMTQFSESALGYSVSGSFLVPGGGIFIKREELKRLGLRKQKIGGIEIHDIPKRHDDYPN